jgi:hypothetical protein
MATTVAPCQTKEALMIVLYNSDSFAVMQVDLPAGDEAGPADVAASPGRSGYEIVDKNSRKGIFLDGDMAIGFRAAVEALAHESQDTEQIDAHLARYTGLSLRPVVLH